MLDLSLLLRERTASIREIQKNPSAALKGITRVMRGGSTFGFFIAKKEMEEWLEDVEMSQSQSLKEREKELEHIINREGKTELIPLENLRGKYDI